MYWKHCGQQNCAHRNAQKLTQKTNESESGVQAGTAQICHLGLQNYRLVITVHCIGGRASHKKSATHSSAAESTRAGELAGGLHQNITSQS